MQSTKWIRIKLDSIWKWTWPTCGAGKTNLERFLVNSATPLVCRMAEGRSLSFFFFIFCLSFFLSLSSCSLQIHIKSNSVEFLNVICVFSLDLIYRPAKFSIQVLLSQSFKIGLQMFKLLHAGVVETLKDDVYKWMHCKITFSVLL